MKNVLLIQCSQAGSASVSRKLTNNFLINYRRQNQDAKIRLRDLADPISHLSEAFVAGMFVSPDSRTQNMKEALSFRFKLVSELPACDDIIISAPMYKRTVPFSLKAWIDHVVLPVDTFRFGPKGQEGFLKGKTAYFIGASGDVF